MPGITNVTARARYYSFYPWALWKFDQLGRTRTHAEVSRWIRRADCLFTMVGIRHRIACGDGNALKHDAALIGSQTLGPIVSRLGERDSLSLSRYATNEDAPERYFMNLLGGLGQYYLGTLDGLKILGRSGHTPGYTPEIGSAMARAFDAHVDGDRFVKTMDGDVVTAQRLDQLSAFCPCQLAQSTQEHSVLLDLFFDRQGQHGEEGKQRRASLGLLLEMISALASASGKSDARVDHHIFRACAYTGALAGGGQWNLPSSIEATRKRWAVYERNELLSVAVQCIFWGALRMLEEERPLLNTIDAFRAWFSKTKNVASAAAALGFASVTKGMELARNALPDVAAWEDERHEISLGRRLLELYSERNQRDVVADVLNASARLLLTLLARDTFTGAAYDPMAFPADYLSLYPVNLVSLRSRWQDTWGKQSGAEWLAWLAGHWGVETHLRVALRKLRQQNQDTFHVVPSDHGLVVAYMPEPTYTTPRFTTSMQVLQDLGAIERPANGEWIHLNPLGEQLRGECHG